MRLPGQSATAEGPHDLKGMYTMHWAFRRDLDRFVAATARTPAADRATWRALAARWELFRQVLHEHHTGEDNGLWPALAAHVDRAAAADPAAATAERAVLDAMEAEHHEINPLLAGVAEGLARLAEGAGEDARAALEVRTAAARERLARHLAHEEGGALPLMQRYLSPEEFEHIEKVYFRQAKSPRVVIATLAWVMHELPAPARARMFTGMAPLVALWRAALRRPFARREARAFRHVLG